MAASLAGARAKVERARELFDALQRDEVHPWVEAQPYYVRWRFDAHAKRWSYDLINQGQAPPPRWGVIIGEIIHDLRSALDHLVWQLVISTGSTPTRESQFPIYSDRPRNRQGGMNRRARWAKMLTGVDHADATAIKALQPYRRTHRLLYCPLAELSALSNKDKHNVLLATLGAAVGHEGIGPLLTFLPLPSGARIVDVVSFTPPAYGAVPLPPGSTELVSFRMDPPYLHPQVRVERYLPMTVAFGGNWLPLHDIQNFVAEVTTILDYFEPIVANRP